jgi:hypothetical protein
MDGRDPRHATPFFRKCLAVSGTLNNSALRLVNSEHAGLYVVANREYAIGEVVTEYGGEVRSMLDVRIATHARVIGSGCVRDGWRLSTCFNRAIGGDRYLPQCCEEDKQLIDSSGLGFMCNTHQQHHHNVRVRWVFPHPTALLPWVFFLATKPISKGTPIWAPYNNTFSRSLSSLKVSLSLPPLSSLLCLF